MSVSIHVRNPDAGDTCPGHLSLPLDGATSTVTHYIATDISGNDVQSMVLVHIFYDDLRMHNITNRSILAVELLAVLWPKCTRSLIPQ